MNQKMKKSVTAVLAALLILTAVPFGVSASSKNEDRVERRSSSSSKEKKETLDRAIPSTSANSKSPEGEKAVAVVTKKADATTQTAKTTETKTTEANPFDITADNTAAIYKAKSGDFVVSPVLNTQEGYNEFITTMKSLDNGTAKKFEWNHDEASKSNEGSFLVVLNDGTRIIYSLCKENRIQAGEFYYQISPEAYQALLKVYTSQLNNASYVQWLIYMKPSNVMGVSFDSGDGAKQLDPKYVKDAVMQIRSLRITEGKQYYPARFDLKADANTSYMQLQFAGEKKIVYDIWMQGQTLYIQNSETRFGCEYTLVANEHSRIMTALQSPAEHLKEGEAPVAPQETTKPEAKETTTEAKKEETKVIVVKK